MIRPPLTYIPGPLHWRTTVVGDAKVATPVTVRGSASPVPTAAPIPPSDSWWVLSVRRHPPETVAVGLKLRPETGKRTPPGVLGQRRSVWAAPGFGDVVGRLQIPIRLGGGSADARVPFIPSRRRGGMEWCGRSQPSTNRRGPLSPGRPHRSDLPTARSNRERRARRCRSDSAVGVTEGVSRLRLLGDERLSLNVVAGV